MLRLKIDRQRCIRCGECEHFLPLTLRHLTAGALLVSDADLERHGPQIEAALANCCLDALTLESLQGAPDP